MDSAPLTQLEEKGLRAAYKIHQHLSPEDRVILQLLATLDAERARAKRLEAALAKTEAALLRTQEGMAALDRLRITEKDEMREALAKVTEERDELMRLCASSVGPPDEQRALAEKAWDAGRRAAELWAHRWTTQLPWPKPVSEQRSLDLAALLGRES